MAHESDNRIQAPKLPLPKGARKLCKECSSENLTRDEKPGFDGLVRCWCQDCGHMFYVTFPKN